MNSSTTSRFMMELWMKGMLHSNTPITTAFFHRHSPMQNPKVVIFFWMVVVAWLIHHVYVSSHLVFGTAAELEMSAPLLQHHPTTDIASLIELTKSKSNSVSCPPSLVRVNDTLVDPSLLYGGGRKIPRLVHISSGSRCNDKIIADNLDTWRLKDHFFFLHDDEAVQTLLDEDWPEFPLLKDIMKCLPHGMGAAWIDLWRLLVLWRYGGIYSDLDTSPVPELFNATTITPDDDAFFVVDVSGGPSQWFMASSPKHPMIYLCIFRLIINVLNEKDLGNFQVVFTTGPGAVAEGFAAFMRDEQYMRNAPAGRYVGVDNRTVTTVGNRTNENMYITRVIQQLLDNRVKHEIYKKTNMTHLTEAGGTIYKPIEGVGESCLSRVYSLKGKALISSMVKSKLL